MTVKELQNEIKSLLDNQDDTFKENAKQLAKDAFGTSSLSRMKKAELQQYYEMLVALVEVEEEEEVESEEIQILKNKIQETLTAMNETLNNDTWTILHERYLDYKMKLRLLNELKT